LDKDNAKYLLSDVIGATIKNVWALRKVKQAKQEKVISFYQRLKFVVTEMRLEVSSNPH